jgi:UDP-glucose:(heptosyl)LPS alpha-1,3-glucosyltransferase
MRAADLKSLDPALTKRVIVNSEMVRREIHKHSSFPNERIHLVRNGLEVDRFCGGDRRRLREQWGVSEGQCVLLFAGSGWERKGLRWLRRALAALPADKFHLVVAGRGRVPSGVGANEHYVGALRREEMPDAYAAADVMVFPTLYDPSANACAEALAAGLPVITTRQNGAAEWVEEGVNGSVVASPAETGAVVSAIQHWGGRRAARPVPVSGDLSLERNARETVEVLRLALGR